LPPEKKTKDLSHWNPRSFDDETISADENKLIEEIRKLRARKEELSKLRPEERVVLERRVDGNVTPGTQAKQFEYHAQQLDRFLQEYKNLQDQLYKMKESCENMQKTKSHKYNR